MSLTETPVKKVVVGGNASTVEESCAFDQNLLNAHLAEMRKGEAGHYGLAFDEETIHAVQLQADALDNILNLVAMQTFMNPHEFDAKYKQLVTSPEAKAGFALLEELKESYKEPDSFLRKALSGPSHEGSVVSAGARTKQ